MTVGKLKKLLASVEDEREIILASDSEGNSYDTLSSLHKARWYKRLWRTEREMEFADEVQDTDGDSLTPAEHAKLKKVLILYP